MKKFYYIALVAFAGLSISVLIFSSVLSATENPTPLEWVQSVALAAVSGLIACGLTFLFIKLFAEQ